MKNVLKTKDDLRSYGLRWIIEGDEVKFECHGSAKRGHADVWYPVKQHVNTCKHKYGVDKHYGIFIIGNSKICTISAGRCVYIAAIGDIPDNMDVDHIDNDSLNNHISNLQLLSRKDNLAKRFIDDPDTSWNQYMSKKRYNK